MCCYRAGIVAVRGIACCREQTLLVSETTPLHVNIVHKRMTDARKAPVSAPDQTMGLRQFPQEAVVSRPRGVSLDVFHQVTGQAVVMYSNFLPLGSASSKDPPLPLLPASGFTAPHLD